MTIAKTQFEQQFGIALTTDAEGWLQVADDVRVGYTYLDGDDTVMVAVRVLGTPVADETWENGQRPAQWLIGNGSDAPTAEEAARVQARAAALGLA